MDEVRSRRRRAVEESMESRSVSVRWCCSMRGREEDGDLRLVMEDEEGWWVCRRETGGRGAVER